jgi:hypothetical protein
METMRLPSMRCQFIHRICRDRRNGALQTLKRIYGWHFNAWQVQPHHCGRAHDHLVLVGAEIAHSRRSRRTDAPPESVNRKFKPLMHVPCMPLRLQRSVSPTLNEKVLRSYIEEAARLRDLAAHVTTARLKVRLLEEAANQERLAEEAKRGALQPHPRPVGQMHW